MIASCGCITDGQKRELKEHGSVSFHGRKNLMSSLYGILSLNLLLQRKWLRLEADVLSMPECFIR